MSETTHEKAAPTIGAAEIEEARSLKYKTTCITTLLNDKELVPNDGFLMYLLGIALKYARCYNAIMTEHRGNPSGVEYLKAETERSAFEKYAFVLRDASCAGHWRVSFFDKHGFSSHERFSTMEEAVEYMTTNGHTKKCTGSLDMLATTKDWERGIKFADLVMQLNRGKLTHEEFNTRHIDLNKS